MEISEFEKKRAANLIWNGAQDYGAETGFRVYDLDGRADVYWNSIIGAIHRHYDWEKLMAFYHSFHEMVDQGVYESLFWLSFENAAFEREKEERPVLPWLRQEYARRQLSEMTASISEDAAAQRLQAVMYGHFHHALGEDAMLPDLVDRKLLAAIEVGPEADTQGVIDQIRQTLRTYFAYRDPGERAQKKSPLSLESLLPRLMFWKKGGSGELGPVRRLAFGYGEHTQEYGTQVLDQSHLQVRMAAYTAQSDEGLREYITNYFGKSIYPERDVREMEKKYCTGSHKDVHLHFTDGSYTEDMLEKGFAGKMRRAAIRQAKENERLYEERGDLHRVQIDKLTERIRNSLLVHMEDQTIRTRAGRLDVPRIWRALYLDDPMVFTRDIRGDSGNLTVDILIDASTSQVHRTPVVAAQGYMIAESLTRCNIPVRVSSYCSMNGYTIVNIFRDYQQTDANRNIFRYFTAGANRDGLAMRVMAGLLQNNTAEHRIVILLADCTPNDMIKVRTGSGQYRDYAGDTGIEDTAAEVHAARMEGITVLCVYTGEDQNLDAVRRIYGRDFARIRSLDLFADRVGAMLQQQLR